MTHEELLKLKGKKITCKIHGTFIDDARIQVEDGQVSVCQNVEEGAGCTDNLNYKYGFFISGTCIRYEYNCDDCTDIKLVERTLDNLEVGDILEDPNDSLWRFSKVIDVCPNAKGYIISDWAAEVEDISDVASTFYSIETLKELYVIIYQKPIDTIEIEGKKYSKEDVLERLKELKPIN